MNCQFRLHTVTEANAVHRLPAVAGSLAEHQAQIQTIHHQDVPYDPAELRAIIDSLSTRERNGKEWSKALEVDVDEEDGFGIYAFCPPNMTGAGWGRGVKLIRDHYCTGSGQFEDLSLEDGDDDDKAFAESVRDDTPSLYLNVRTPALQNQIAGRFDHTQVRHSMDDYIIWTSKGALCADTSTPTAIQLRFIGISGTSNIVRSQSAVGSSMPVDVKLIAKRVPWSEVTAAPVLTIGDASIGTPARYFQVRLRGGVEPLSFPHSASLVSDEAGVPRGGLLLQRILECTDGGEVENSRRLYLTQEVNTIIQSLTGTWEGELWDDHAKLESIENDGWRSHHFHYSGTSEKGSYLGFRWKREDGEPVLNSERGSYAQLHYNQAELSDGDSAFEGDCEDDDEHLTVLECGDQARPIHNDIAVEDRARGEYFTLITPQHSVCSVRRVDTNVMDTDSAQTDSTEPWALRLVYVGLPLSTASAGAKRSDTPSTEITVIAERIPRSQIEPGTDRLHSSQVPQTTQQLAPPTAEERAYLSPPATPGA